MPIYVSEACCYISEIMSAAVDLFPDLALQWEKTSREHGPVDYCIISRNNDDCVVGVLKAKYDDLDQGVAQNVFQLEAVIADLRLISHGIVTNSRAWIFLECRLDGDADSLNNIPSFRRSDFNIKKDYGTVWKMKEKELFKHEVGLVEQMSHQASLYPEVSHGNK